MQIKVFTLPVVGAQQVEEDINRFLRSHRVLQLERHFCPDNGGYWTFLVEYMDGEPDAMPAHRKDKSNPTEGLNDEEKTRFDKMRSIRRQLAEQRGLPAYTIFTDKELAQLARVENLSGTSHAELKGIAPSRLQENLKFFTETENGQTGWQLDGADSRQGEPV